MRPDVIALLGLFACAGGGNGGGSSPSDTATEDLGSVYAADNVNTECHEDNLLEGGGFEAELLGLDLCGNAVLQQEHAGEGSRAVRLRTDGPDCTEDILFIRGKAAQVLVPLPDVDFVNRLYTIRFKLRVLSWEEDLRLNVNLTNLTDPEAIFGDVLLRLHEGELDYDGYVQYSLVWRAESLGAKLDPNETVYLEIELQNADTLHDVVIDDVEVVPYGYYPCGEPMEPAFAAQGGDLKLVAVDPDANEFVVFQGDGSGARSVDVGLGDTYRFSPAFSDPDHIVYPVITFNDGGSDDLKVVPASGTDVFRYDLRTGDNELVYQTLGSPGTYEAQSYDNIPALDIEMRQSVFDLDRGIGIFTICGRNRQVYGVLSDDLCLLTTVDANTFEEIEGATEGFFPNLSRATGQVAYYDSSSIVLGAYDENGVTPGEAVYRSSGIGTLATAATISPDGSTVVFADATTVEIVRDGVVEWVPSLFAYDVATERTRMLHPMDFGQFFNGFAWTPDSQYLVYSVLTLEDGVQTWWLNVETGATGPITTEVQTYSVRGIE
ncbi:MAG: hypothetical protein AAGA48_30335 [Myxococcota bacterium]